MTELANEQEIPLARLLCRPGFSASTSENCLVPTAKGIAFCERYKSAHTRATDTDITLVQVPACHLRSAKSSSSRSRF